MIPEGINEEALIDQLDHEKSLCELNKENNGAAKDNNDGAASEDLDHDNLHGVKVRKEDENNDFAQLSLTALIPEEDESKSKLKKLKIEYDEAYEAKGFQDIRNAGKFWRAAQLMGTRKGTVYYLMCTGSSEPG